MRRPRTSASAFVHAAIRLGSVGALALTATLAAGQEIGPIAIAAGVQLTIPEGWVEIPEPVIADAGEVEDGVTRYGFQPDGTEWLSMPYALVDIHETGRMTPRQLRRMADTLEESFKLQLAETETIDQFLGFRTIPIVDGTVLTYAFDMEPEDADRFTTYTWIRVSEFGFVSLSGFSPTETYLRNLNAFEAIADSIELRPGDIFTPQDSDRIAEWLVELSANFWILLIPGLVAAVLVVLIRRARGHDDLL